MEIHEKWMDYVVTDENGMWAGVRDDAPEWAKRQYQEYQRKRARKENGLFVK